MKPSVFIGFDVREAAAFAVAKHSLRARTTLPVPVRGLVMDALRAQGLYWRPTERSERGLWDVISEAPMSTEFAITRFLTPLLARTGWALFMDSDVLVRANIADLFAQADPKKAVMCVQHDHRPTTGVKMDGQAQLPYMRKNWSSVMLFNCDHPSNRRLTLEVVNTVPGRDLHRFYWLKDDEIGALEPGWNWLVGHSDPLIVPKIVHFTDGFPLMPGYEQQPFAGEWREELTRWADGQCR